MQDHLREYAAHLDERAEQIRDDLYWWEKMGLRIRGRKGDVPLVDETEGFLTRERENLEKYESLRERLRTDYKV
jgi:hypothetical protein